MAAKHSTTFKDRGNNGWGLKQNRQHKHVPAFQTIAVLDLEKGGKIRFERVPV